MCSSCGGARAARIAGGSPATAIVIGEDDGSAPQPATFLQDYPPAKEGEYKYVKGDGVDQAVEDGVITLTYVQKLGSTYPYPYYVNGRGFTSRSSAERYAGATGGTVQTRDELLAAQSGG